MLVLFRAGLGLRGAQMKRCMGVAVQERERQQNHQGADPRGSHNAQLCPRRFRLPRRSTFRLTETAKTCEPSIDAIPPAVAVRLVPYVWAIPVVAVTVMVMPCGGMVLMELLVRASVGAVPVFVLLRIDKTPRMRRVVLVIELLVKLLMLQM